jgi:hypothetical protein
MGAAHGPIQRHLSKYGNNGVLDRTCTYRVSLEIILVHFLSLRMVLDVPNKLEDHGCISLVESLKKYLVSAALFTKLGKTWWMLGQCMVDVSLLQM